MASPNLYVSGIGGSSGDSLVSVSPLYTSGDVWYVSSASGVDAASPAGKERNKPLATLAQAYTNAAAGDIIVVMTGHSETIASSQTLGKAGLLILGEGTGTNRPLFTKNADIVLFDITATRVTLSNLRFAVGGVASTSAKVKTASTGTVVRSCYFTAGPNDTGAELETVTGAAQLTVADTTFLSSGSSFSSRPESAIKFTNAITDVDLSTVVLDGGTYAWSNPYALNGAGAVTRLRCDSIDLYNDSDVTLATGTSGYVHVRNKSGSARVVWAA